MDDEMERLPGRATNKRKKIQMLSALPGVSISLHLSPHGSRIKKEKADDEP